MRNDDYYTKKNTIRKKFMKITIILFIFVLLLIGFIGLLFPLRPKVSEVEKRELTKFPKPTVATFMNGEYPRWSEFIMSPYSTVFRQSDLIAPSKWENTRVYQDIWKPKGIFWGLFMSASPMQCFRCTPHWSASIPPWWKRPMIWAPAGSRPFCMLCFRCPCP